MGGGREWNRESVCRAGKESVCAGIGTVLPLMVGTRGAEGKVSLSEPWLTLVFVPPAMEADDSIRGCLACCHAVAGGAGGVTGERKGKSTPPLANE